jgi:sulfatase maturation enzyme AslB (radical SAM superfamily)
MVGDLAERTTTDAPRAFHLLAKPTGAVCNLDCSYCFFLSKEMLYPGSRFRMAEELLETYIRQLIEAHASVPEVTIAWQGGEPTLMGVDFFRRSVELAASRSTGRRHCTTRIASTREARGRSPT